MMTEQEKINNKVQTKISVHDEKFNSIMARVDATNEKVDMFIEELRDRDNRRAAENEEIRNSIKEILLPYRKYLWILTISSLTTV